MTASIPHHNVKHQENMRGLIREGLLYKVEERKNNKLVFPFRGYSSSFSNYTKLSLFYLSTRFALTIRIIP